MKIELTRNVQYMRGMGWSVTRLMKHFKLSRVMVNKILNYEYESKRKVHYYKPDESKVSDRIKKVLAKRK